ncbi:hypothetical protein A1353_18955 [Methylomonas methanica]|uniref:Uncharacterized protein n=1 Tax=Methylomonas methanica TaxID=421 RepID=A0A177M5H4_METMH|nr:hypothetical protein [Methylomonas methanica]OAI00891.1 hypothetical protein A1353_18955 [Methylomonas methanica]
MDIEEFVQLNTPASTSGSKLFPYLADLHRLRELGYSYKQIQSYLAGKDITVSIQGIASYLARHQDQKAVELQKKRPQPRTIQPEPVATPARNRDDHIENGPENKQTYFDPSDLREILSEKINLDQLAKLGKPHKKTRKKPHETGSD